MARISATGVKISDERTILRHFLPTYRTPAFPSDPFFQADFLRSSVGEHAESGEVQGGPADCGVHFVDYGPVNATEYQHIL